MYDIRATHALVDEYVQNILPLKNIQSKHIPKNTQQWHIIGIYL